MEFHILHIPLFITLYIISIAVHELGHLIFGLATGYKFSSFRIMSFMWIKDGEKIKFKRMKILGTEGQCLMSPPDLDSEGRLPVFLYNMGGVIVGAVFALIQLVFALIMTDNQFWYTFFMSGAVFNAVICLLNGIPMSSGGINNDGHNAISLGKSKEAMRAFRLQMLINTSHARGLRVKDMPIEWFYLPSPNDMSNSMVSTMAVFYCDRLMDEGRYAEADALMSDLISQKNGIVGIHKKLMVCERIFCELIGECRFEEVDSFLIREQEKFMKQMETFPTVIRTKYALALLRDHNESEAKVLRSKYEQVCRTYPYKAGIESENEMMDIIDRKYAQVCSQCEAIEK